MRVYELFYLMGLFIDPRKIITITHLLRLCEAMKIRNLSFMKELQPRP